MKKVIITSTLLLSLSTQAVASSDEQQTKNELIGFGTGTLIGAAIAGPVGAAVAGIFGIVLADDVNDRAKYNAQSKDLAFKQQELLALEQKYQELQLLAKRQQRQASLQQVSFNTQQPTANLMIPSSIQFKTASHKVEDLYHTQLNALAKQLKTNTGLRINLSGYADRRGDEKYNAALSQQRAISVKQYLLQQGVSPKQISTRAYGEKQPSNQQQNFENDFFDRRVLLKIEQIQPTFTAAN